MARVEYYDFTVDQLDTYEKFIDALNEATGEEFEVDSQYVFTEAIGAWGEDVAWEVIEEMEDTLGVAIDWTFDQECGAIVLELHRKT